MVIVVVPSGGGAFDDGDLVTADRALEIGLVDEVVDSDKLRDEVRAYARTLCEKPPEALAAIRRTVTIGGGSTFEEGLAVEREAAISLAESGNFTEGVAAFLEKRQPEWRR